METPAAELSPALQTGVLNLDYFIGGVFVIVYAASRFNTPATNRSTTTWLRYHVASTIYFGVGLLLFGLLAAYQPLQAAVRHTLPVLGLDHDASDVAARLSPPLLAALFLTVLLPVAAWLCDRVPHSDLVSRVPPATCPCHDGRCATGP
jgi:Na+/proline symporter